MKLSLFVGCEVKASSGWLKSIVEGMRGRRALQFQRTLRVSSLFFIFMMVLGCGKVKTAFRQQLRDAKADLKALVGFQRAQTVNLRRLVVDGLCPEVKAPSLSDTLLSPMSKVRWALDGSALAILSGSRVALWYSAQGKINYLTLSGRLKGSSFTAWVTVKEVDNMTFQGGSRVRAITWSHDGSLLASVAESFLPVSVKIWEVTKRVMSVAVEEVADAHEGTVAMHPNMPIIASISGRQVTVWEALSRAVRVTVWNLPDALVVMTPEGFFCGMGDLSRVVYVCRYQPFMRESNAVSSVELMELSKQIPALKQVLILDTCEAGGMNSIVAGLYDSRVSVLARALGMHLFAGAKSYQDALDNYQGNGLFTHFLLKGLRGSADGNRDEMVTAFEMNPYLTREVRDASKGMQVPFIRNFGEDLKLTKVSALRR